MRAVDVNLDCFDGSARIDHGEYDGRQPGVHAGYTLIEITVVLLVIGIVIGIFIPSIHIPATKYQGEQKIQHIWQALNELQERSQYTGIVYALRLRAGRLYWYESRDGDWHALTGFEENENEDLNITLSSRSAMLLQDHDETTVFILPDGRVSTFRLHMKIVETSGAVTITGSQQRLEFRHAG